MTDKPQWRTEGDTQVCEWRGMRATVRLSGAGDGRWLVRLGPLSDGILQVYCAFNKDCGLDIAESLMLLNAERDRLRKRVEVLEHIREIAEGADIRWRDEVTFNRLLARLAELDKETDDDQA